MYRSLEELRGYEVHATDGVIGKVKDMFFDDSGWEVRWLVVDTGNFLPGRKVLVPPSEVDKPDWESQLFPVDLTKQQIKESPTIDDKKPVSRQQEFQLTKFFGWHPYWVRGPLEGAVPPQDEPGGATDQPPHDDVETPEVEPSSESHLRSIDEVRGYHIQAEDGDVGHIQDFIVNDDKWSIRYLVIDTRNLIPGKKVLLATSWVHSVSWEESTAFVSVKRQAVKDSPEFDPTKPINKEYEDTLYDYYGRPVKKQPSNE